MPGTLPRVTRPAAFMVMLVATFRVVAAAWLAANAYIPADHVLDLQTAHIALPCSS